MAEPTFEEEIENDGHIYVIADGQDMMIRLRSKFKEVENFRDTHFRGCKIVPQTVHRLRRKEI